MFLLCYFYLVPTFFVFLISFTSWPIVGTPRFIGVTNYFSMFKDDVFLKSMLNTLYYAAIITPSLTIFSFLLALVLRQITKGREFFKVVFVFPMVVTLVSTASIWKGIFLPLGPLNHLLAQLNIGPIMFLSAEYVKITLAFILIWRDLGYFSIFYLAGLEQIPQEIVDASKVDGANSRQRFFKIIWPMMRPMVLLVSVLSTIGSFQIFTLVHVTTRGGPAFASLSILNYIYQVGWQEFRMGYAGAISVIYFAVLFALTYAQRLVFKHES